MASTRVLVKRRKAVRNIKKITRTMELIATARFKKAMDRASEAEAYTRKIAELVTDLSATAENVSHPLLKKHDEIKNEVLLVLGSNRGLCGGYNAGILREAMLALKRIGEQKITPHLELSGKRPINFFRFAGIKAEQVYTQFEDKPTFAEVEPIADRYIKGYMDGTIDRVEVAYMKFMSASTQKPVIETLLPLDVKTTTAGKGPTTRVAESRKKTVEYEFAPSASDILTQLLPESFKVRLFKCFLDAAVSEQIARRVTMKQATENANDMIKALTQEYNRARQAGITKEILEIVSGADALS
ncbi:MAG: ATP synthase F1 subunit gamma [Planctomycetia bacterium]|nr:ATP synthase F1 subunit gamma [Planctomycetia bacterium]